MTGKYTINIILGKNDCVCNVVRSFRVSVGIFIRMGKQLCSGLAVQPWQSIPDSKDSHNFPQLRAGREFLPKSRP